MPVELLLVNPRSRTASRKVSKMAKRKSSRRKGRSAAQRAATARLVAWNKSRRKGNPAPRSSGKRRARRRTSVTTVVRAANPIRRRRRSNPIRATRRRRNPISLSGAGRGILGQLKDAAIGGAGSVAVDLAYGQVAPYLPASLQRIPGQVGLGDAVKAIFTVALGSLLSRPTRGLSRKMAAGALTVQAAQMIRGFVPATMAMGRVGYYSPAPIIQGTQRINPIRPGVNAYMPPGSGTPLLSAYMAPGAGTPLLSGAREREGVSRWK